MSNSVKKSDYSANKSLFAFKADSELRGINATCKVIVSLYDSKDKETLSTFAYDSMNIDSFRDKSFIGVAKKFTPNYFDSKGQICRLVKLYKDNTDTKERYESLDKDFESLSGIDGNGEYKFFKIPIYKWSTLGLYNFAKRAYKAQIKVGKVFESLSGIDTETLKTEIAKRENTK